MLTIVIPNHEFYDEKREEFIEVKETRLCLEHSLVSISKWESKYEKPFLDKKQKTTEEILYYIKCMTITQNVNPIVYEALTEKNVNDINDYIESNMTATTFVEHGSPGGNKEIMTSEIIYYYMIMYGIPFECQKWHIKRLITLIRVCSVKNSPAKKMSKKDTAKMYRELNAQRRAKMNSKG